MSKDRIPVTGDRCRATGTEPPPFAPRPSPPAHRHAARSALHAKTVASRRGFTLVEILVAIAILAVVLSTIYVSYLSTMRIVKSLEYGDEIYYMARITLERMVLDLQSACKEKDAYEFSTLQDSTGKLPLKGVTFLSRAHLDFSGPGDSMAVAQISYELEGDPESGGFSIVRRDVLRQGQGREGGEGHLLCRRLQFVNLRFYDAGGREYTLWDSRTGSEAQRNGIPSAVLIELDFINPDDAARPYKFMTRLLLPGSARM